MDAPPRRPRGRPPATEQARDELRLKISRAAVRLFREQGVAHTTVAEIAAGAGISERTFWRHFASKEDCIRPLVSQGLAALGTILEDWPPGTRLAEHAIRHAVTHRETPPPDPDLDTDTASMADLVTLVENQRELQSAWLAVHREAETRFAAGLGDHFGEPPEGLRMRVLAAMVEGALRAGVEHAVQENGVALDDRDLADAFRASLTELPF